MRCLHEFEHRLLTLKPLPDLLDTLARALGFTTEATMSSLASRLHVVLDLVILCCLLLKWVTGKSASLSKAGKIATLCFPRSSCLLPPSVCLPLRSPALCRQSKLLSAAGSFCLPFFLKDKFLPAPAPSPSTCSFPGHQLGFCHDSRCSLSYALRNHPNSSHSYPCLGTDSAYSKFLCQNPNTNTSQCDYI